jgi:pimeloyl-ACP methyl ester carboxylesterase
MMPPTVTTADGLRIAVHELGGQGPAVLLAHATGFHGHVWEPLAADLAGHYHCVAFDHRGHGDSDRPGPGGLAWSSYAEDTTAVAEAVVAGDRGGRLLGVGHSMGGTCLLLAEARRPGTFGALALFEPVVFPPMPDLSAGPNSLAESTRRRRADFPSLAEAEANYAAKPPMDTFDPAALSAYVRHGFRPDGAGGVTLKCRPEDEAATYENGPNSGAWDVLGEVACPVLVIRGAPDTPGPAMFAEQVAFRLPHGQVHADDELGHFGPLEHPHRLAAVIGAFFASLRSS